MTTEGLTRHTGLVTSLSWIPTEAIQGAQRLAFDSGITHYDPPPPTEGMDVVRLRDEDRFRFANELRAFVTVDDGRIVDCGYEGGGLMGTTLVNLGAVRHRFQAVQLPDIQRAPNAARAGSGSSRPAAVAPASRRHDGYAGAPSCSGRPRWCGRRCR